MSVRDAPRDVDSAAPPSRSSQRLAGLDGLRGVAAAAVLVTHVGFFTLYNVRGDLGPIVGRLNAAIPLFFMISGLVLYLPFVRADFGTGSPVDLRRFALRRAARILPVYWIALLISQLMAARPLRGADLLSAVFMVNLYWPGELIPLLEQSWTISVEVAFYVALPVLAALGRSRTAATPVEKLRRHLMLAGGMFVGATVYRVGVGWTGLEDSLPVYNWFPNYLDQFAIGMAAASLLEYRRISGEHERPLGRRGAFACWVGAFGALMVAAYGAGLPVDTIRLSAGEHLVEHALYTVVAALVLTGVVLGPGRGFSPAGLLSSSPLRWLGAIAYSFYLSQNMVFEQLTRLYPDEWHVGTGGWFLGPALPLLAWSFVLAVAAGIVGYMAVEWPTQRALRSSAGRGLPRPANLALAAVAAAGLLGRFATLSTVSDVVPTGGDPYYYHAQANMLADGLGFGEPFRFTQLDLLVPTAIHPPGYSAYLGAFSWLGARTLIDHKLASILLGTVSIVLVGLIGRRLGGDRAGLLAAIGAAVYPNFWLPDGILMPEGMFICACAAVVLLAYRWRDRPRTGVALSLGVLIGVAAMARGEGLLLWPVLVVPWMWTTWSAPARVRVGHIALAALGCTIAVAPWMVRNLATFEEFVPLSTNGDEVIFYANCPESYAGEYKGYWFFECQERIRRDQGEFPGDESQRAKAWRNLGIEYMSDHKSEVPGVLAARVGRTWELYRPIQNAGLSTIEGRDAASQKIGLAMYVVMAPLVVAGWWMARRRGVPTWPLVAQAVCVTLTSLYAYGADRFRAPAEITWVVLATLAVVWLWERFRTRVEVAPGNEPTSVSVR